MLGARERRPPESWRAAAGTALSASSLSDWMMASPQAAVAVMRQAELCRGLPGEAPSPTADATDSTVAGVTPRTDALGRRLGEAPSKSTRGWRISGS
eukprot:2108779-Prymnesium_polylepis.1